MLTTSAIDLNINGKKHKRIIAQGIREGAIALSPEHSDYATVQKLQEQQRIKERYIQQLEATRKEMTKNKKKEQEIELSR